MRTARLVQPLIFSAFALLTIGCNNPQQQDEDQALTPQDGERHPGNDGGFRERDLLDDDRATTTEGTVDSYTGTADDDAVYDATVGGTEDNVNFTGDAINPTNDPVTPNAPLADGTAGQPSQAANRSANNESIRNRNAGDVPGTGATNSADRPYGNNEASPSANIENGVVTQEGLKEYVTADMATNMPVYAPGENDAAYIGQVYGRRGSDGPRNAPVEAMEDDEYRISLYAPAMSDVAAASYNNTQTKLFPKPGAQNFVRYQPMQLKFVPLLSWNAPVDGTTARDKAAKDSAPRLGGDCANSDDPEGCSSAAFDKQFGPLLNDPRVARSIAQDKIDAFRFELDAQGRLDPGSIVVMADGKPCTGSECARFRSLVTGVIAQQQWTAATKGGMAVATRVMVPLRYGVGTNKNMLE